MPIFDKEQPKKHITLERRYTGHISLQDFCKFAKTNSFLEVTTWTNHEGYDIYINSEGKDLPKIIQLTNGEFEAIKSIIKQLNNMP